MDILNSKSLESNRQIKINFDRGDLPFDTRLLLSKEYACKLDFIKILQSMFKTNDTAIFRVHKDNKIYGGWFTIFMVHIFKMSVPMSRP